MAEADQSLLMPRSVSRVAVGASPQPTTPEAATGSEALVVRVHAPAAVRWCSAACHVLLRGETRSIVGNGGPACGSAALLWPGDDQCMHCHAPTRQFIGTHYHHSWQADFEAAPLTTCKFRRVCAPCALVPRWRRGCVCGCCACCHARGCHTLKKSACQCPDFTRVSCACVRASKTATPPFATARTHSTAIAAAMCTLRAGGTPRNTLTSRSTGTSHN